MQAPSSASDVPLESVLCTEELNRRPARPPDFERENRALVALAQALADSPRTILQTLADTILEVFRSDSAGISLVTVDGKRFHWPAIAGVWKPHLGGGTPRDFGPCGDVLDRHMPLMFRHFERRYTYLQPVMPPAEECLLVPFYVAGQAVGTIWAITHDDRRKFDAEDMRQLVSLGRFASSAYQAVESVSAFAEIERLRHQLEAENAYLREEVHTALAFGSIVGQSPALRKVLPQLELVAPTEATVLILGESGTGKELVAREIHERSRRANRPLIKVNCSAVPRDMFESEFFGHVRGAFTGAVRDRPGRFQLAHRGTIFLDEVGDLPLELQAKLLRVLQEGQYERVGEDTTRQVDVRVLAATNRDLQAEVRAGRFREDLYYRLSVFPIELPPLRARKEDISVLAAHFVSIAARRLGVAEPRITIRDCEELTGYDWPGNIRELQNVIERAVILSDGERLRLDMVSLDRAARGSGAAPVASGEIVAEREWRRRERANILAALKQAGGHIHGDGGAAALLGIRPSTLQSRLKALRINPRDSA